MIHFPNEVSRLFPKTARTLLTRMALILADFSKI
jgi:hypothetical protein